MRWTKIVGLFLGVVVIGSALALWQQRGLPNGTEAPDFKLETLDGKTVCLSDLKGKPVFLDFWASWCEPCRRALPHTEEFAKQYKDKAHILTINLREDAEKVRAFIERGQYTFSVLMDVDGSIAQKYGVRGIPHFVIIDAEGKIFHNQVGYGPGMEKSLKQKLEEAIAKANERTEASI